MAMVPRKSNDINNNDNSENDVEENEGGMMKNGRGSKIQESQTERNEAVGNESTNIETNSTSKAVTIESADAVITNKNPNDEIIIDNKDQKKNKDLEKPLLKPASSDADDPENHRKKPTTEIIGGDNRGQGKEEDLPAAKVTKEREPPNNMVTETEYEQPTTIVELSKFVDFDVSMAQDCRLPHISRRGTSQGGIGGGVGGRQGGIGVSGQEGKSAGHAYDRIQLSSYFLSKGLDSVFGVSTKFGLDKNYVIEFAIKLFKEFNMKFVLISSYESLILIAILLMLFLLPPHTNDDNSPSIKSPVTPNSKSDRHLMDSDANIDVTTYWISVDNKPLISGINEETAGLPWAMSRVFALCLVILTFLLTLPLTIAYILAQFMDLVVVKGNKRVLIMSSTIFRILCMLSGVANCIVFDRSLLLAALFQAVAIGLFCFHLFTIAFAWSASAALPLLMNHSKSSKNDENTTSRSPPPLREDELFYDNYGINDGNDGFLAADMSNESITTIVLKQKQKKK